MNQPPRRNMFERAVRKITKRLTPKGRGSAAGQPQDVIDPGQRQNTAAPGSGSQVNRNKPLPPKPEELAQGAVASGAGRSESPRPMGAAQSERQSEAAESSHTPRSTFTRSLRSAASNVTAALSISKKPSRASLYSLGSRSAYSLRDEPQYEGGGVEFAQQIGREVRVVKAPP